MARPPQAGVRAGGIKLNQAFADVRIEMVELRETPGKLAVVFRRIGRHVGPWRAPLGVVAPTGRQVTGVGIDILTLTDGRISRIWVLADELQRLLALDAVRLATRFLAAFQPGLRTGSTTDSTVGSTTLTLRC